MSARLSLAPLLGPRGKEVEELLLWRNPVRSGLAFAAITTGYLLLEWGTISFVGLFCNLAVVAVLAAAAYAPAARALQRPPLSHHLPAVLIRGLSEAAFRDGAEKARVQVNRALALVGRLAAGHEPKLSAQVAAALWFAGSIARVFSLVGLTYTLLFFAFTLPRGYEWRKRDIDSILAALGARSAALQAKLRSADWVNGLTSWASGKLAGAKPAGAKPAAAAAREAAPAGAADKKEQ